MCACSEASAANQLPMNSGNPPDKNLNIISAGSIEIYHINDLIFDPDRRIKHPVLINDAKEETELVFTLIMMFNALMLMVMWILMLICHRKDLK